MSQVRSGCCLRRCATSALCALLLMLLCAPSRTISATAAKPRSAAKPPTAILLVAKHDLSDPDFSDSVVLVMNNLGPAPVGIIVNRPTPVPVSRLFPDLKRLTRVRDRVYFGGPVEFGTVWFLFRAAKPPERAIQAFDGVYLSADRKLLIELLGRDKPMDGLRIFVGHAGWAPGQLEDEIAQGAWGLERAAPEAIFNGKSEHPWPPAEGPKPST